MTTYATGVQLAAFTGVAAPADAADAARLLVRASELIDQTLKTAIYDTDPVTNLPTNAAILQALADATCAQVEFWMASDEEDDVLGPIQGVVLGGLQIQYGAGDNRTAPMYLAPRAARILTNAGLIGNQPVSW